MMMTKPFFASMQWLAGLQTNITLRLFGVLLMATALGSSVSMGQSSSTENGGAPASGNAAAGNAPSGNAGREITLVDRQAVVAGRFLKLEELLLRLADMESAENPDRAALLRRTAKQSRDKFVHASMDAAAKALSSEQYREAVEKQESAFSELKLILKLLQSEDRSKRIRDEKERFSKLIQKLKKNLNNQRSTRARTENGADLKEVEKKQKEITKESEELAKELSDANEPIETDEQGKEAGESGEPEEGQPSESEPSDSEPSDSKPSESEPSESEPSESEPSESKPSDSKPSDSEPSDSQPSDSKPSDSKPSDSKPSDSKPSDSKPSDSKPSESKPQTPAEQAQEKLEKAAEKMKEAEEKLEEAKRNEAVEKQLEAETELRQAIDELEKILRQLREEEMERELAKLEARVRRMAAMQQKVLDKTVDLAKTPPSQRDRRTDLAAGKLVAEQKQITIEADRALLLLREEGSSVAFPELMSQVRADSETVVDRLARTEIGELTQTIQTDVIASLEEMIEALVAAQRDLEDQKKQEGEGQPSQSGQQEQPLVAAIAELKLIRTMETRIQKTTNRYSQRLESDDSRPDEVLPLLQTLAGRQNRLYKLTRDLVMKRNQ